MLVFFSELSNYCSVGLSQFIMTLRMLVKIVFENKAFFYLRVELLFAALELGLSVANLFYHSFESHVQAIDFLVLNCCLFLILEKFLRYLGKLSSELICLPFD